MEKITYCIPLAFIIIFHLICCSKIPEQSPRKNQVNIPIAYKAYFEALESPCPKVREQAAIDLGNARIREAIYALEYTLNKDRDNDVIDATIQALVNIKDPMVVDILINSLDHLLQLEHQNFATNAAKIIYGLARIEDQKVLQRFSKLLQDSKDLIRRYAVNALAGVRDPRAVSLLISSLKNEDYYVRETSIQALAKSKDPRALEGLREALKDKESGIRFEAMKALAEVKDPRGLEGLRETLRDKDINKRIESAMILANIGEPSAFNVLRESLGKELGKELDERSKFDERTRREKIIICLADIKDQRAEDIIKTTLDDKSEYIRIKAIESLSKFKSPQIENLLKSKLNDKSEDIRNNVIATLARIKSPIGIELLYSDAKVGKVYAIQELDIFNDLRSVTLLDKLLKSDRRDIREAAADTLATLTSKKNPHASQKYFAALESKDTDIRDAAIRALNRSYPFGDESDERAILCLSKALKNKDWNVRIKAVEHLGGVKTPRAINLLISTLEDKNGEVREFAAKRLGEMGGKKALPALLEHITDWYPGPEAVSTLENWCYNFSNQDDKIHFMIGKRNFNELRQDWIVTKETLLKDMSSDDHLKIENALNAFIGIGKEEIIPVLIKLLDTKGNKIMAETYLNCGHPELKSAGADWATKRGYYVGRGSGAHPVEWGKER